MINLVLEENAGDFVAYEIGGLVRVVGLQVKVVAEAAGLDCEH
jgi:hypothetical protein